MAQGIVDDNLRILTHPLPQAMMEHRVRDADGFLRTQVEYLEGA